MTEEFSKRLDAYYRGRNDYYEWFKQKGSTCIDGTGPQNPYEKGTQDYDEWEEGSWLEYNDCVLVDILNKKQNPEKKDLAP